MFTKSVPDTLKMMVKGGAAVDPESSKIGSVNFIAADGLFCLDYLSRRMKRSLFCPGFLKAKCPHKANMIRWLWVCFVSGNCLVCHFLLCGFLSPLSLTQHGTTKIALNMERNSRDKVCPDVKLYSTPCHTLAIFVVKQGGVIPHSSSNRQCAAACNHVALYYSAIGPNIEIH